MFNTQMIAALMLGMASGASAQPATSDHVARAEDITTMDIEHRAGKLAYSDRIANGKIGSDQIAIGPINRDSYGVVTVVEMKTAGVVK